MLKSWFARDRELNRKTRWIRILISIALLTGSIYGSYVAWWQEKVIEISLETPEGREALARALIDAAKKEKE